MMEHSARPHPLSSRSTSAHNARYGSEEGVAPPEVSLALALEHLSVDPPQVNRAIELIESALAEVTGGAA